MPLHVARRAGRPLPAAALLLALAAFFPVTVAQDEAAPAKPAEPTTDALEDLENELRKHPFFSRISYQRLDDYAPTLLYVQDLPKARRNYHSSTGNVFGPWLAELERIFVEDYVEPLGLVDNGRLPVIPLVVLASKGDYINYADATTSQDLYKARAHYDPGLRIAVTYKDSFSRTGPHRERRPALHEFVHALQHRYSANPHGLPEAPWFNEGLADYLSYHLGREPGDLRKHHLDTQVAEMFVAMDRISLLRDVYLHPLAELTAFRSYGDVVRAAMERSRERGRMVEDELAIASFYAQSYLLVHYLHHGEEGRHAAAFRDVARRLLAGEPGEEAFRAGFEGVELEALERGFRAYVYEAVGRGAPTVVAAEDPCNALPVDVEPPPNLDALALDAADAAGRVAMAVHLAMESDPDAALAELDALRKADVEDPALVARIAREYERLRTWVETRDGYLQHAIETGELLTMDVDGERVRSRVQAIEAGVLILEENRYGVEALPLSVLLPAELTRRLGADVKAHGPEWLRIYPYCATGDAKWQRLLRDDDSPEVVALRADAEDYYPGIADLGGAMLTLERLRAAGIPETAAEAEQQLERIRSLWTEHRALGPVARREQELRRLAAACLRVAFSDGGLAELLHASTVREDGDTVHLEYSFEDEEQGLDFVPDPTLLEDRRRSKEPVEFPDRGRQFAPGAGEIHGRGAVGLRHVLQLAAPLRISAKLRFEDEPGLPSLRFSFLLGACADQYGNFVSMSGVGSLLAVDTRRGGTAVQAPRHTDLLIGQTYSVELRLDENGRADTFVNGREACSANLDGRLCGSPFLWIHSDLNVHVRDLVLEGRLTPATRAAACEDWVRRSLRDLGFLE